MVALEGASRLWFVVISVSSLLSVLIVSVVSSAAASDGILSYAYDKILLKDSSPNLQPVKQQTKVMQHLDQGYNRESAATTGTIPVDSPRPVVSSEGDVSWTLLDSKGNEYRLALTKEDYLKNTIDTPANIKYLATSNGIIAVNDYSEYVKSNSQFSKLADEIHMNAGSDNQFIYEVWYIVTHATEYSHDDVENVSSAIATLFYGKGDCGDFTILMASILASSSYTKDWEIMIVYFDAYNAAESITPNHVALFIKTNGFSTFVETTNSTGNGLYIWERVDGWYLDVPRNKL